MFDAIASRYDLVNRIISLGMDQGWRRRTVDSLGLSSRPGRVLDLATGTADLALLIAKRAPQAQVVGSDPSENMLAVGREKVARSAFAGRIQLEAGDAQELPYPDASFDGITIAFGIRNVPDRQRALREMARVCKPGGRVAILELSEPGPGLLGSCARFHVHHIVPWVGSILSGAKEYRYLQKSIAAFPTASEFASTMERSGLAMVEVVPFIFGVAHLYVAEPSSLRP